MPSKKKVGKESNRGGARVGAGRPPGTTKVKVSISIDAETWEEGLRISGKKPSHLVEGLLQEFVANH